MTPPTVNRLGFVALIAVVLCGAALRLVWGTDIEYKADEAWTFEQARHWSDYPTPWLGMPSSQGPRNPGLSLWVFAGPTQFLNLQDPVELARFVQVTNILALILLIWFSYRWLSHEEREPWLWAIALACVNPLAVLFQRKIWPPSLLPFLLVLVLMGWWKREQRLGSFTWGLLCAVIAQIHLGGLFYGAGIALWTWLFSEKRARWRWWLMGGALGALPMIPWVVYMWSGPEMTSDNSVFGAHRWLELKFWTHWITEPLGIGLQYTLKRDYSEFLSYPLIGGHPSYLILALHVLVLGLGIWAMLTAIRARLQRNAYWKEWITGSDSSGSLAMRMVLLGFGLTFSLAALPFYRQYLLLTFPFMYLWVAKVLLTGGERCAKARARHRGALVALCVAQLLITVQFLGFIHERGGSPHGEYGRTYRWQKEQSAFPLPEEVSRSWK